MQLPSGLRGESVMYDYSSFENEILASERSSDGFKNERAYEERKHSEVKYTRRSNVNFFFDPNTSSAKELEQVGFFPSVAERIINYRNKGGKFYSKRDLLKVYGVKESFFLSIEPWIRIDTSSIQPVRKEYQAREYIDKATPVDLNVTDSSSLVSLPGIGAVLANRIIKYRNALGGFVSKEQLKEIYGLKEETLSLLNDKIVVSGEVSKFNLNTCTADQLKQHPYFRGRLPYVIVQYREKHGNYSSVEEVRKTDLVNEELYLKIAPYLTVE